MVALPPFAHIGDYEDAFGDVPARTGPDLAGISAAIRRKCRWHIWPQVTETLVLDGPGTDVLVLPTKHLVAVTAVTEAQRRPGSTPVVLDVSLLDWSAVGLVNHPSAWSPGAWRGWGWTSRPRGITITITHGYEDQPDDLRQLVLALAKRSASNPGGLSSQQVGQRLESYTAGMFQDERDMLNPYMRYI